MHPVRLAAFVFGASLQLVSPSESHFYGKSPLHRGQISRASVQFHGQDDVKEQPMAGTFPFVYRCETFTYPRVRRQVSHWPCKNLSGRVWQKCYRPWKLSSWRNSHQNLSKKPLRSSFPHENFPIIPFLFLAGQETVLMIDPYSLLGRYFLFHL